ncbi:MAG: hypothetical protein QOJ62_1631, partial [Actinomycetota bacterium]|nr:hypothetical protein [Actinomycetota bacterium]
GDYFCWWDPDGRWVSPPAEILGKVEPARGTRAALVFLVRGDLRRLRQTEVDNILLSNAPGWSGRGPVPDAARDAIAALSWQRRGN